MTEKLVAVLADDESGPRGLVKIYLEQCGFKVHEAKDGKEAASLVTEHKPQLLVTDFHMPELTGAELVKQLRNGGNHQVHVLGISGMAGTRDDPASMRSFVETHNRQYTSAPTMHFLEKPFKLAEFTNKIHEMGFRA